MKKNLLERYAEEKAKPTAAASFISEVAEAVKKPETTIRMWFSRKTKPTALEQETLARHFNTTPEELFNY